jgi:hypothetical protein
MRRLVFLLAFGCSSNALPVDNNGGSTAGTNGSTTAGTNGSTTAGTNGSTTAGTNGSTTAGTNGSTTAGTNGSTTAGTNGSTTAGTNGGTTGGPPGAPCKTACDCMVGLACFQNMCVKSPMGMLYCCDSSTCPSGQFCQGSDGSFAMCGSNMTTGSGGGCKTACDCPTGEACFNGGCVTPPMGKLYCCDNGSCPSSGGFCQASDGSFGQCGGGTNGGPAPIDAGVSCNTVSCMSSIDCVMNGCFNGCSQSRHMCR